jgi:hypothetical protein
MPGRRLCYAAFGPMSLSSPQFARLFQPSPGKVSCFLVGAVCVHEDELLRPDG